MKQALRFYDSDCDSEDRGAGRGILAQALYTQSAIHAQFGGVVPELASRDHVCKLLPLIDKVLKECLLSYYNINGISYTKGRGLIGALMVGACVARSLAFFIGSTEYWHTPYGRPFVSCYARRKNNPVFHF